MTDGNYPVIMTRHYNSSAYLFFYKVNLKRNGFKEIKAMEMDVIPPGTHVNAYEAYDILCRIKTMADILIPLHEPAFAAVETIPQIVKSN